MATGDFRKALLPAALLAFGLAGGYTAAQAQSQSQSQTNSSVTNPSVTPPNAINAPNAPTKNQAPQPGMGSAQSSRPMTDQSAATSTGSSPGTKALSHRDRSFISSAAQGGLEEVENGKLASQKSQNPQVKDLADRMVQDHGQANDKLKQLASDKGVSLPDKIASSEQREMDKLQKLSGDKFDQAFTKEEVADHKKVIKEFEHEAKYGSDPDLKQFAQDSLPTLREHLRLAEEAQNAAKTGHQKGS